MSKPTISTLPGSSASRAPGLPVLQVKQLTIVHKKDLTTLVDNLSFTLTPGDRIAIIGEEGNGKSTILKLLYQPALVEPYVEWSGEITGKAARKTDPTDLTLQRSCLAGYLAQELTPEELALPVGVFCQNVEAFAVSTPKLLARTAASLGLDSGLFYDWRPMATLSGGERVKLRLALLLLQQPEVLLFDEPSNDLDRPTLDWLGRFLLSCPLPLLYVSHDESLLTQTANRIIHLERLDRRRQPRTTVARVGYAEYIQQRSAAFARQEKTARKEQAEFTAKMERYRKIRDRVDHEQATISRQNPHGGQLLKKKMHAVQAMGRRFAREQETQTALPQWEQAILTAFDPARTALPSGKTILRLDLPALSIGEQRLTGPIQLCVTGPERVGIVGTNGVGKSTLLKQIADTLLPRSDLRAAYMPQNYDERLLRECTPIELLAPSGQRDDITRARTFLGAMQYQTEEMEHTAAALSGGQRAKLLFLGMVLQGANVLLLDEPTRNFSPLSVPVIRQTLADFSGCIISVSHDRLYLRQVCTRVLELSPQGLQEVPSEDWPKGWSAE